MCDRFYKSQLLFRILFNNIIDVCIIKIYIKVTDSYFILTRFNHHLTKQFLTKYRSSDENPIWFLISHTIFVWILSALLQIYILNFAITLIGASGRRTKVFTASAISPKRNRRHVWILQFNMRAKIIKYRTRGSTIRKHDIFLDIGGIKITFSAGILWAFITQNCGKKLAHDVKLKVRSW